MEVIIYWIIATILLIGITIFPINNIKQNLIARIILSIILILGINIIIAIITYWLNISCSLELISIIYSVLIFLIVYVITKSRKIQKLSISVFDIAFIIITIVLILVIAIKQYGIPVKIKYESTDASTHFSAAIRFMESKSLVIDNQDSLAQYFKFDKLMIGSYVNTGIIFSLFSNFLNEFDMYKIYIICDLITLLLSFLFMYILITSILNSKKTKIIAGIMSIIYVLAYPLNSMLMGSAYLTLSLVIIQAILYIIMNKDKINNIVFITILTICNIALMHTYIMFGIVVLLAEIIYIIIKDNKKIYKYIPAIIIPMLTLLLYSSDIENKISVIQEEGPMYKNYYSNIILYIPLIIYALYIEFKEKKLLNIENLLLMLTLGIVIITYILKENNIMSSYYCLKYYYMLWIPVIFISSKALLSILNKRLILAISIALIIPIILIISATNIKYTYSSEEIMKDISKENVLAFGDYFAMNKNIIYSNRYVLNGEEIEVIKKADEIIKDDNYYICGGLAQVNWTCSMLDSSNITKEYELKEPKDIGSKYLIVFKRATYMHNYNEEITKKYTYIFENKYGGIMQKIE